MRSLTRFLTALSVLLLVVASGTAFAQANIAGVVRDSSGGVLPGVTVEAASPALIEKTRSVQSDATGRYQIVDLRPGVYTVTFSLQGFSSVKREGIEITGTFTANINADMKVGALEETVVVTGETPVVDVHSTGQERVMNQDLIDAVPTSRLFMTLGVLIPGMNISGAGSGNGSQDVGGLLGDTMADLTINGSKTSEERLYVDGMSIGHPRRTGSQASGLTPNMGSTQEVSIAYTGGMGESETSGVRVNMLPKEGGNRFTVSAFLAGTASALQSQNYTAELAARGLTTPNRLKRNWDINPSVGGPLIKDKLWFYSAFRDLRADNYPAGIFPNLNASNPLSWTYVPDPNYATSPRPVDDQVWRSENLRLTWQVNAKNKISVFEDEQQRCRCHAGIGAATSPEATSNTVFGGANGNNRLWQATWTSPVTNRLLLEAGMTSAPLTDWGAKPLLDRDPALYQSMIRVTEQSLGVFNYRSLNNVAHAFDLTFNTRASATYVTGAHSFKVGYVDQWAKDWNHSVIPTGLDVSYRFANGFVAAPVPNQFTMNALPAHNVTTLNVFGLYVQDQWTIKKFSLSGGLRYDAFQTNFPDSFIGPGRFVPNAILYPETPGVSFKDILPRGGVTMDVFGTGKTAVKVTLGRYVVPQDGNSTFGTPLNPVSRTATTTTRSWNDSFYPAGDPRRGNYVPDCDLANPAQNLECGSMSNQNFALLMAGRQPPFSTTYDPNVLSGWGVRLYDWEFSAGIQQELMPRVSLDINYTRRWYGNFTVTDNLAVAPSAYDPFTLTAPLDSRLPGGGGFAIPDLFNINNTAFPLVNNLVTNANVYGKQIERYNGIDFTLNARPRRGLLLNGGVQIGRTLTDNCDVAPKLDSPSKRDCHVANRFFPNIKALGAYTIPRIEVQASATFQSVAPPALSANYNATNADVRPTLGRNLSGGIPNTPVNLILSQTMFGDRLNQLDVRIGKILKFGKWRSNISLDVFNALNSNVVTVLNNTFSATNATVWQRPNSILAARFVKVSAQIDF